MKQFLNGIILLIVFFAPIWWYNWHIAKQNKRAKQNDKNS